MADAPKPAASGLPVLDRLDSRVIQDLALSDEPDVDVLARYGFSPDEAAKLAADPFIQTEVKALVTELRRAGTTAKIKARLAAENLIDKIYNKAKIANSLQDMLDAFKALAKVGDLEPRNDGAKVTGTIVRVDLNIGALGFAPAAQAVAVAPVEIIEAAPITQPIDVMRESQNLEHFIEGSIAARFLGMELDATEWSDECP